MKTAPESKPGSESKRYRTIADEYDRVTDWIVAEFVERFGSLPERETR